MSHTITLSLGEVRLLEPAILENIINDGVVIEPADVIAFKQANENLAKGKPYAVLVNFAEVVSIKREAKELVASKNFKRQAVAQALLINSTGQKIVANFYLKFNKPHLPTKAFTDRERAMDWLRQSLRETGEVV